MFLFTQDYTPPKDKPVIERSMMIDMFLTVGAACIIVWLTFLGMEQLLRHLVAVMPL